MADDEGTADEVEVAIRDRIIRTANDDKLDLAESQKRHDQTMLLIEQLHKLKSG